MKWAYGVTTVPERRQQYLPKALASLKVAGFDRPRLFVDGSDDPYHWSCEFQLEVTARHPKVRTYGNWILSLWELYLREPVADVYALFQDDLTVYRNLRHYIERMRWPEFEGHKPYLNLYTFPVNQDLAPPSIGWYPSNQMGKGAVALMFLREHVTAMLAHQHMVDRVQDAQRGYKSVDGAVVSAMRKCGYREYVHNPSLVQHWGEISATGNGRFPQAPRYRGDDFDALELLTMP